MLADLLAGGVGRPSFTHQTGSLGIQKSVSQPASGRKRRLFLLTDRHRLGVKARVGVAAPLNSSFPRRRESRRLGRGRGRIPRHYYACGLRRTHWTALAETWIPAFTGKLWWARNETPPFVKGVGGIFAPPGQPRQDFGLRRKDEEELVKNRQ